MTFFNVEFSRRIAEISEGEKSGLLGKGDLVGDFGVVEGGGKSEED